MAYSHRAATAQGNATGGALTVTAPTGLTNGDLIIVADYLENDTNTWASVGAGFTQAVSVTNTGLFTMVIWWKWASSEPGTWTWTPTTSNFRNVITAAYSGGSGSGNPFDVSGTNQGDGVAIGSQTAPSVTTTASNDVLIFAYSNFSGSTMTTATGAATGIRAGIGGTYIVDNQNIATPSATGTSAPSAGTISTEDFGAIHAAFFLTGVASGLGAGKRVMSLGFG